VTAANKLLTQDKAIAIIGASSSGATLAVKPITDKAGIPLMAIAASNAITADPIAWVWRAPPKDGLAVAKALTYMQEKGYKKIGLLYDDNAYGSSGAAEIEKVKANYGVEVVAKESYKTADTDLTAQLTKIKGANPDVLLVWGTNPGPAVAAKGAKQLGLTIPFMGSHGIANQSFITLAGDAAEGVTFPAGHLLVPSSVTDPKQKEVVDKFVADYSAATGKQPPTFAGHAWGALTLLLDAVATAKSTDPAAIQTALNATSGVVTPDGTYNYTATDHDGLAISDLIMVTIEGGKWVLAK
jgi:branched-chain amino acid transport system substrate-binding protein